MTIRWIVGSCLLATTLASVPAQAGLSTAHKRDAAAASAVVAGALAAGPAGAVVGALGGKWLAQQITRAGELDAAEAALTQRETQIAELEAALDGALEASQRYAQMALDHLQLEMLFHTGDSELTPGGVERLALLADFLRRNEQIEVSVDGYADPRGDAAANLALSTARAEAVAAQLAARGVAPDRIAVQGHGAAEGATVDTDLDAFALQRVVRIELHRDDRRGAVASVDLPR
jgi:outer membrane protein OmpA-like peptidoglycan-associated protein